MQTLSITIETESLVYKTETELTKIAGDLKDIFMDKGGMDECRVIIEDTSDLAGGAIIEA